MALESDEQGAVDVRGESVRYEIRIVDARSTQQREQDAQRGRPGGNIMVVVPGHGQSGLVLATRVGASLPKGGSGHGS